MFCVGLGLYTAVTSIAPAVSQTLSFWYVAAGASIAFAVILTLPETKGSELR